MENSGERRTGGRRTRTWDDYILHKVVFEGRYEKGYKYWDACGDSLLELDRKSEGFWKFRALRGEGCHVAPESEEHWTGFFGWEKCDVGQEQVKNLRHFQDRAATFFGVLREKLSIQRLSRVGIRFWCMLKTESLEEAQRIIDDAGIFKIQPSRLLAFGTVSKSTGFSIVVENANQQRSRISVSAVERKDPKKLPPGMDEEMNPEFAVLVDIDTYREEIDASGFDAAQFIRLAHKAVQENVPALLTPVEETSATPAKG